jgi:UPF0042 nucleotide-binding protein
MSPGGTLVVVVTGLSGAGKSTAVNALEDLGFFCVDNLPTTVVPHTLAAFHEGKVRRIALGIDIRVRGFLEHATRVLDELAGGRDQRLVVLFLDATDEALLRRFSSTRRPHPLSARSESAGERTASAVIDGIRIERELLAPLRARATLIIDTTELSVHELRQRIASHFGPGASQLPRMRIRFLSFGFKYGPPVDADVILDVRFLRNPFFVAALEQLPGTDSRVREYVLKSDNCLQFLEHAKSLLEFCLPCFEHEGKSYATIAIGCTGGRHRSVVIVDHLATAIETQLGLSVEIVHRDVDRWNNPPFVNHRGVDSPSPEGRVS